MKADVITKEWLIAKRGELKETIEKFYGRIGYARSSGSLIESGKRSVTKRVRMLFWHEFKSDFKPKKVKDNG